MVSPKTVSSLYKAKDRMAIYIIGQRESIF